jgi:hypothetical protein
MARLFEQAQMYATQRSPKVAGRPRWTCARYHCPDQPSSRTPAQPPTARKDANRSPEHRVCHRRRSAMAVLKKNSAGQVLLKFETLLPEGGNFHLAIRSREQELLINPVALLDGWLHISNDMQAIERVAVAAGASLELVFFDGQTQTGFGEPLLFDLSFFAHLLDLGNEEFFPPFTREKYNKPTELAVFTHLCNETLFLKVFLDYYSKVVPSRDIYIIDHGSECFPSELLRGLDCQVVHLPRGEVDHVNIKRYCEFFQRFLLTQYRWVVHVDCDELLVHRDGPQAIRTALAGIGADCVLKPGNAYHLVQHPDSEAELDPSQPITSQRNHLTSAMGYQKPAVAAVPTSWMPGFHAALNQHQVRVAPHLCLIHLALVSVSERLARNRLWKSYASSASDQSFVDHQQRFLTEHEVRSDMRGRISEGFEPLPDWLKGQF